MGAEVALCGGMRIGIDVQRIIRTCLQARLTAYALLGSKSTMPSSRRYNAVTGQERDAGSIIAVIAAEYREMAAVIGELACLDLLHPGAIHTQGHVMLRLARHRARMATDCTCDYQ